MNNTFAYRRSLVATIFASLLLGGCGGDSNDNAEEAPRLRIEGGFIGTFTGAKNGQAFRQIVLENEDVWMFYGSQAGSAFYVGGLIQGRFTQTGQSLSSTNTVDFGAMAAVPGSTNAIYDTAAATLSGTFSSPSFGINAPFANASGLSSLYNYSNAASLPTIQGNWRTSSIRGRVVDLQVTLGGDISGVSISDCNFSGRIAPRASLKNVFDVSLTLGPAPCGSPGETATGIAIAYPLADGQTELLLAFVNAGRTWGWALSGRR